MLIRLGEDAGTLKNVWEGIPVIDCDVVKTSLINKV